MTNVERTREFWRVWSEEGLSGLLVRYDTFFTEDFEWHPPIEGVTGAHYVGREGFSEYVADVGESLGSVRATLEEATEIAPGIVRSRVRVHGAGSASGAVIDAPLVGIGRWRDGRSYWAWGSYDLGAGERLADAIARGEAVEL